MVLGVMIMLLISCGKKEKEAKQKVENAEQIETSVEEDNEANDKGYGDVMQVDLNDPLDQEMVKRGKGIYDMKCAACHKLSGARVVGPSWEGITKRRTPEWIMNMITNVDVMLEKDPEAQKLLEECLTRMPNQDVSIGDARDVLEFMFQNDKDLGVE